MKYFTKRNFTVLTKYINIISIIILLIIILLRIRVDLFGGESFNLERYILLIILVLIFYFDNFFTWVIGIGISAYGIYEICVINIHKAMPGLMDFAFYPLYYHLPFSDMTSFLKHRFSYGFYISMIIYSSLIIIFKLYEAIKSPKIKGQDLDDILDA